MVTPVPTGPLDGEKLEIDGGLCAAACDEPPEMITRTTPNAAAAPRRLRERCIVRGRSIARECDRNGVDLLSSPRVWGGGRRAPHDGVARKPEGKKGILRRVGGVGRTCRSRKRL